MLEIGEKYKLKNGFIAKISFISEEEGSWPIKGKVYTEKEQKLFDCSWTLSGYFVNSQEPNNFDIQAKI